MRDPGAAASASPRPGGQRHRDPVTAAPGPRPARLSGPDPWQPL